METTDVIKSDEALGLDSHVRLLRLGFGPGFGLSARAFLSSASISFRSDFETRKTCRSALSNIAALGRLFCGLAIFCGYNTPVGRRT
jgi:hypothetical protein